MHPLSGRDAPHRGSDAGGGEKKVSEKFAGMEKTPYLCRRFPSERSKKVFYEIIWIGDDEREERSIPGNGNR